MLGHTLLSFLSAALLASTALAQGLEAAAARPSLIVRHHNLRDKRAWDQEKRHDVLSSRATSRLRFNYGKDKVRGVGLGGWLVIEDFITPSIYQQTGDDRVIDEWSFATYTPRDKAEEILKYHYDNFITEDDFAEIASYNLNHVRVPFPYWGIRTWPGQPYIKLNQFDKLKQAAHWAEKYGLKMIIELHTVPGGANPYDHGGHTNHTNWLGNEKSENRWLDVLDTLAAEFSQSQYPAVTGISLVNEPLGNEDEIYGQYKRGYNTVRRHDSDAELLVIVGDAFQNPASSDFWNDKFSLPEFEQVMMDTHIYRLFDPESIAMTQDERIGYYCSLKDGFAKANEHLYMLVGEWSPAFTDCARGLNGRFLGHRYDGTFPGSTRRNSCKGRTGNAKQFSEGFKANLKKNFAAQADAYSAGAGWIMWTWKTEHHNADEWSYRAGVRQGWIPRDPTNLDFRCS